MPRGDRTGPDGMGPMTGRAAGQCAGFAMPGYANPASGRGLGFGRGRGAWSRGFGGRGRRNRFFATGQPGWQRFGGAAPNYYPDAECEKQSLKARAEAVQGEMEAIRRRLEELEKEEGSK